MAIDLQDHIQQVYDGRGYDASPQTLVLGLMEEVGELAQTILLTECDDFQASRQKQQRELERDKDVASEVGDVITYALALCNRLSITPRFKFLAGLHCALLVEGDGDEQDTEKPSGCNEGTAEGLVRICGELTEIARSQLPQDEKDLVRAAALIWDVARLGGIKSPIAALRGG